MAAPRLIFLAGPNGAGKSTFYETFLRDSGLPFVNADRITAALGISNREAAEAYGVSEPMARMRMNVTAARVRVSRSSRPAISSTSPAVRTPPKSRRA